MPSPLRLTRPVAGMVQCGMCGVRATSVCNAIEDAHLTRLAAVAVTVEADPGQIFIGEGEPVDSFFNITVGTAKLFKLLPDGRRQITGFAGAGHFLGLAVSDTYAFGA
jgi:CRP/FNR family transcriptional regulator